MPVIATQRGYYAGRIIEAGEPVPLAEGDELGSWMTRSEGDEPEQDKPVRRKKAGAQDDPITGGDI